MNSGGRAHRVPGRAALLAAFAAAFAVLLALVETRWGPLHRLDVGTARSLHRAEVAHPQQASWWRAVSAVFGPTVLRIVAAFGAAALWLRGRRWNAVFVVVAVAGAAVLEASVKAGVGRARPAFVHPVATAAGASFPSGHAMTSLVAFGVLLALIAPRGRATAAPVAAVVVALVGVSRLALGVHYVSDVVAGWLLGAGWLVTAGWIVSAASSRRDRLSR